MATALGVALLAPGLLPGAAHAAQNANARADRAASAAFVPTPYDAAPMPETDAMQMPESAVTQVPFTPATPRPHNDRPPVHLP